MIEQQASEEQVQDFLKARIPNFEETMAQAMLDFRALYVATPDR